MPGVTEAHGDDDLRAGNEDRDAVVQRLNEAYGEGRLDLAELDERVATAYKAKTLGELRPLLTDLPNPPATRGGARPKPVPVVPPVLPTAAASLPAERTGPHRVPAWIRWQLYPWAFVVSVNVLIWLFVSIGIGHAAYFWPVWVAGPWGAAILAQFLVYRSERRYR